MLRRINADGTPDWNFAGDGIYRGPRNRGDYDLHEIVVEADGTIVGLVLSTS